MFHSNAQSSIPSQKSCTLSHQLSLVSQANLNNDVAGKLGCSIWRGYELLLLFTHSAATYKQHARKSQATYD